MGERGNGIEELRNCEFRNWGFEGLHFGYLLGSREQAVGISNFDKLVKSVL